MLEIKNPYPVCNKCSSDGDCYDCQWARSPKEAFNEGATAYHEAVVKWLWEPCTEHFHYHNNVIRKDCPDCMKEFGGK